MEDRERQEKLIEAAVALLDAAPGHRMGVTSLNKALFYLDLAALRDRGETLTGNVYIAVQHGPIMHRYKEDLLPVLQERHLAHVDELGLGKPIVLDNDLPSYRYLDDYWRTTAAKVAKFVISRTAGDASRFSHENAGWTIAWKQGMQRGGSPAPIDMNIAMQQVLEADPWVTEAADDEFMEAVTDADGGEPWE